MTVGFALVGLGNIAERVAGSLQEADGAQLVAVCSRDPAKGAAFSSRHGGPVAYSELDELLKDSSVEAIYLSTPNALHARQALTALEAGKHVLVEKPMALTVDDARAMAERARELGLVLGVGFHLRFHPVHEKMRHLIAEGHIGTPTYAEGMFGSVANIPPGQWQVDPALAGHGSLTGLGVHVIDILPWLLSDRIAEVAAVSDGPSDLQPVEALTTAVIRFESGVQGTITSSRRLTNASNSVRIYGSERLIEGDGTMTVNPAGVLRDTCGGETSVCELRLVDHYRAELESFARAIGGGEPFGAPAEAGVTAVAVTSAIAEAAATGRAVKL